MNNRRSFLWKLICSILLAICGPTIANKFLNVPVIGKSIAPAIMGYKGRSLAAEGVIYAPYMPLMVTKNLKWTKGEENYLAKAYGIMLDE